MHKKLHFKAGGEKYYFQNGVHQGSPLSPGLFDIYLEDFIVNLKTRWRTQMFYLAYADDIVFIIHANGVPRFLDTLF
jgi:hypothetical protein